MMLIDLANSCGENMWKKRKRNKNLLYEDCVLRSVCLRGLNNGRKGKGVERTVC